MPGALDQTITVTLPDDTIYGGKYELRLGDCTGLDDLDVRRETGMTLWGLIRTNNSEDGFGLLLAVSVVWLVRRKQTGHTTFQDVANSVSWGKDFTVEWNVGEEEDEGNGEGSEADIQKSSEPSPASTESDPGKSID
jgi:hypothetical protein